MSDPFNDLEKISRYLEHHVAGFKKLNSVEKFPNGQSNPTYLLNANSGQYVLRMQPAGELLKSAHAVDREFKVMQALHESDVPVPAMFHLCLDKSVLGTLFFVMEFSSGRVFWDPALPDLSKESRGGLYDEMNRVLAALHNVDVHEIGLEDFGRPGNYYARQVKRWTTQYEQTRTRDIPEMDELIDWVTNSIPEDDWQVSLIHGDYRLDNIMFANDSVNAIALLDWELATLGHPISDLAYQCMQWRLACDAVIPGLGEHDRASLGIPNEQSYVELYCERRGLAKIENWPFYLAFSFFRFAAIVDGVLKRSIDGNASSPKAVAYGELTPVLSKLGLQAIT